MGELTLKRIDEPDWLDITTEIKFKIEKTKKKIMYLTEDINSMPAKREDEINNIKEEINRLHDKISRLRHITSELDQTIGDVFTPMSVSPETSEN